ncbi:MAG: endonuclease/exonuclease/phosphatase family protein [Elusimicrobia bacterium]|nr:endonuclease/exonuclease/phosphatase family protein [Elusimicrobiota bacterium]
MATATLSAVLLAGLFFCYGFRSDSVAAITVFPHWVWVAPAAFLMWIGFRNRKGLHLLILLGWLGFIVVFSDSPFRYFQRRDHGLKSENVGEHQNKTLRVVSLNCAGGSEDAAREVIPLKPDIVFLQEVPEEKTVLKLTKDLFGEFGNLVRGEEAAILVSGKVTTMKGLPWFVARAKVELPNGVKLNLTTFRLKAPIVRADLWNPECWRVQKADRIARRKQLKEILDTIEKDVDTAHSVMGGDFNAPPGDAIFRLIGPGWSDAFEVGGTGWGATMPNNSPFFRIDRIFKSNGIRVVQAKTAKTNFSDHRALIVDMSVQ